MCRVFYIYQHTKSFYNMIFRLICSCLGEWVRKLNQLRSIQNDIRYRSIRNLTKSSAICHIILSITHVSIKVGRSIGFKMLNQIINLQITLHNKLILSDWGNPSGHLVLTICDVPQYYKILMSMQKYCVSSDYWRISQGRSLFSL